MPRPELGREHALGERHADRRAEALAERSGGRLDARRHEAFGMPRRLRVELAEALQLVDRDALDAGEVQERVEQHRAVAGGEHEAVAVGPARIGGVVFQELREQHRRDVGGAHRQARDGRISPARPRPWRARARRSRDPNGRRDRRRLRARAVPERDGGRAPVGAPGQGRRLVSMGLSRVNSAAGRQQDRIAAHESAP